MSAPPAPGVPGMVHVLRSHRRELVVSCLCGIANQGLAVLATVVAAALVAAAVAGAGTAELLVGTAVVLAVVLLRGLAAWWEAYVSHRLAFEVLAEVRGWLYRAFVRIAPGRLVRRRSGDLVNRAMVDSEGMEMFYAHTLIYLVVAVVLTPLPLVALAVVDPWLLPAAGVPLLLLCTVPFALRRANRRDGERVRQRVAHVHSEVHELVAGLREVVVLDPAGTRARHIADATRSLARAHLGQGARAGAENASTTALTGLTLVSTLAVAALLVREGDLAPTALPVVAALAAGAAAPVTTLFGATKLWGLTTAAADRVFELLEEPAPTPDTGTRPLAVRRGEVRLERVRFRYGDDEPWVLHGVDLRARPGELLALVGASGAGKTTMAHLLLRMHDPQEGRVLLDGTDVREVPQRDLYDAVALVPQDVFLFHDTVRANVVLGRPEAGDADVRDALRRAQVLDVVEAMPDGLDTVVGERGARLSGGERQRLAIARALVRDTPVLVLDEPVSQLDAVSEQRLRAALQEARRDRTTVVVAHRLSTILAADRVVVVEAGRVVDEGRHADLLQRCPAYARLVLPQSERLPAPAGTTGRPPLTTGKEGHP